MITRIKSLIFIFSVLSFQPCSFASVEDLLDQQMRPSIADVEKNMSKDFGNHVFLPNVDYNSTFVAIMIAELEWAYPGAIYMPLGRDTVFVGDYIDAFYRSQGQPGRVIRLNASTASLNVEESLIVRFIQSSGVDIKNLKTGPSFVFFDGSRLTPNSQSIKILRSVYSEYVRQGGKAEDILTKFAFFNTYKHTMGSVVVAPKVSREMFFQEQITYLQENPNAMPTKFFAASNGPGQTSLWHDSFGALLEHADGSVSAPAGGLESVPKRREALTAMQAMIHEVRSLRFLAAIRNRAKELGYEFKFKNCDVALEANQ